MQHGLNFTAHASLNQIEVYFRTEGVTYGRFDIDDISVDATPIPEHATMSLLGLGALAMVLRRKIRK